MREDPSKYVYDWQRSRGPAWYRDAYYMSDDTGSQVAECFSAYIPLTTGGNRENAYRCIVRPKDRYSRHAELADFKTKDEALEHGRKYFRDKGLKIVAPGADHFK